MVRSVLTFFNDPGHAWLHVTPTDLTSVGLTANDFSQYSYRSRDNQNFYLEEDCDAPKFIAAYEMTFGVKPVFAENYTNSESFIRRLPPIR